jgi:hypothetical protein
LLRHETERFSSSRFSFTWACCPSLLTRREKSGLAERFGKRKPNLKAAADLIDDTTITSPAEIKKAAMLVKAGSNGPAADALVSKIKTKVATQPVGIEIESLLDTL